MQQWKRKDPQVRHLFTDSSIFLFNTLIASSTSWAGCPGFTSFKLVNRGYYDHRHHTHKSWERRGCKELYSRFTPKTRVVAFGFHPQVLDMACSVQSYYDITGSGGDVYLVKNWHILKNI